MWRRIGPAFQFADASGQNTAIADVPVERERILNAQELSILVRAVAFAAHKHKDQRRKDDAASPYINHPVSLMDVLVHEGGIVDLEIVAAALLHDTIEDTETTGEEIEAHFGDVIRGIVEEVTDDKALGRVACKQKQIDRAPHLSVAARAVKLADKICNLRDMNINPPSGWDLARRQAYFDWAKQVIDGLRGHHAELERLFDEVYGQRPER